MSEENNEETPQTPETPQESSLTENDIKDMIVRTVNAAVGGRMSRELKKIEELIADKMSAPEPPPVLKDDKSSSDTQLKQLQAALEEERRLRIENENSVREKDTRGTILQAFEKQGVTGSRARAALAMLYTDEKTIRREEDGNIYFFAREKGVTDPLPMDLDAGIERFLNTDEGKMFLPPKPAGGSGTTGGQPPNPGKKEPSDHELLTELGNMMLKRQAR